MANGFIKTLNLDLVEGTLSSFERDRAAELRTKKYAATSWTQRI
jgi:hypothetical protein